MNLNALRTKLREKRCNLSHVEQQQASKGVISILQGYAPFLSANSIGSYWPVQGELDLRPLQTRASQQQYLPVLQENIFPWAGKGLIFGQATGPLTKNRFGIPEPLSQQLIELSDLDLVLMPLVAFDRQGSRIGMGGGYYDRALMSANNTLKVGVGYGFQEVEEIVPNKWDIPLDAVVTENELILINR